MRMKRLRTCQVVKSNQFRPISALIFALDFAYASANHRPESEFETVSAKQRRNFR